MKFWGGLLLLTALSLYTFLNFEIDFPYSALKDYFSSLQAVSGMIFTIMGIWIAFIYPNALQRITNPEKIEVADFSETLSETKRLETLVMTVMESAIVLTAIMVFYGAKVVLSSFNFYSTYIDELKAASLSLALALGILQLKAIYEVIASNLIFINELHRKREEREEDDDI